MEFMGIKNKVGLSKVESQDYMILRRVLFLMSCVNLNKSLNLQGPLLVCIMEVRTSVLQHT